MNIFHDTKLTVVQRIARCLRLALVLLVPTPGIFALNPPQRSAAVAPVKNTSESNSGSSQSRSSRPYLAMVGPAALRFSDAPPVLPPEPPTPILPKPKQPVAETGPDVIPAIPADTAVKQPNTDNGDSTGPQKLDPNAPKPISILPDDTKREIRAEDVLPFFQFPGALDNSSTAIPFSTLEPVRAKPSTATYRQQ